MLGSPKRTAKLSSTCQLKSQFSEGFEGVGNTCDTENVLYGYATMHERRKQNSTTRRSQAQQNQIEPTEALADNGPQRKPQHVRCCTAMTSRPSPTDQRSSPV